MSAAVSVDKKRLAGEDTDLGMATRDKSAVDRKRDMPISECTGMRDEGAIDARDIKRVLIICDDSVKWENETPMFEKTGCRVSYVSRQTVHGGHMTLACPRARPVSTFSATLALHSSRYR